MRRRAALIFHLANAISGRLSVGRAERGTPDGHEDLRAKEILSRVGVSLASGESVKYMTVGVIGRVNRPLQAHIFVTDRRVIFVNQKVPLFIDMDLKHIQSTSITGRRPNYNTGITLIVIGIFFVVLGKYAPVASDLFYVIALLLIVAGIVSILKAKPLYVLSIYGVGQRINIYSIQREQVYELNAVIRSQLEKIIASQGEGEKK